LPVNPILCTFFAQRDNSDASAALITVLRLYSGANSESRYENIVSKRSGAAFGAMILAIVWHFLC
jgi:hypothetical protein